MHRLAGALLLVVAERRLVDEHVGAAAASSTVAEGAVSPVTTTRPPGRAARRAPASDVIDAAVRERDRLAALEGAALRAERDAERVRRLDVEAARALGLDERVADRATPCADGNDASR